MKGTIHREITPLRESDCFLIFNRKRGLFTYPIHFHPEYEINFIANAQGARRVVGDHMEEIGSLELVMVGSNLYHGWENYKNDGKSLLHEITLQFPPCIFDEAMLCKNLLAPIREMFKNSSRGILFSQDTTIMARERLESLTNSRGFDSFLEFQSLLHDLATSRGQRLLTNISFQEKGNYHSSERIEKIHNYIKANFHEKITLEDAAGTLNMSVVSFSRLIKNHTGKPFIDFVNEIRLGHATRLLIESDKNISEICHECGFNNISNFNRTFKKKQGCTPTDFRVNFNGTRNVF